MSSDERLIELKSRCLRKSHPGLIIGEVLNISFTREWF